MNQKFRSLFSLNGTFFLAILSLVIVGCFSVVSYFQYSSNLYADIDGFSYLNTVGSVWNTISGGTNYWIDPLRSPLLILFIPPQIDTARFAMIGYLLISTFFIYLITRQLTKKNNLAFIASVAFGTIPYLLDFTRKVMSDIPAIAIFLAGLYLFVHGYEIQQTRTRYYLISSTLMGFSFLVRFDMAILILPIFVLLLLKDRKSFVTYLIPFLFISVLVELLSTYLYLGQIEYLPWTFVYSNFFTSQWSVSHHLNASYLFYLPYAFNYQPILFLLSFSSLYAVLRSKDAKTLLIVAMFIFYTFAFFIAPKTDPRVYVINYFAVATLLSAILLAEILRHRLFSRRTIIKKISVVLLLAALIIPNVALHVPFSFSRWDPQNPIQQLVSGDSLSGKRVLSNCFQGLIYFIANTNSSSNSLPPLTKINQIDCILLPEHDVTILDKELKEKDYDLLLYFEYPEISNFTPNELSYIMQNYRFQIFSCGVYNLYIFYLL